MRTIDYFLRSAERFPDRPALVEGSTRLSYRETDRRTRRIANAMAAGGFEAQGRVALYGPNSAELMLCLLACWRARGVWIPVNTRNALDANIAYLNYVRADWLMYHSSYAGDVARIREAVPTLRHCVCLDRPHGGDPSLDQFEASVPDDLAEAQWADPFGNLDDLIGLIPTGGTTGPSKGVEVTNLGWGTMIETAAGAWVSDRADPVCLTTAPITHAAGPVAMSAIALGATIVILPGFDALAVMQAIETHRVSHLFLPPTALYTLLAHPRVTEFDYASLRIFLLAGAPVAPDKLKRAVEIFGPAMCQSYGQTESPMFTTWLPPSVVADAARGIHPERLKSCGQPTGSVRLGIMDDAGTLLATGDVGEIVVRGALVSRGYFELPDATEEVRGHGWHHTGDVGYRDEEGFVYIVDRKKDMIITGGFNVFSAEVEAAVMALAGVRECAVIGVPDEKWGERVTAIVALAGSAELDEAAVIAHAKGRLGSVKAPKTVEFWPEIPRTPAGKFDKKAIRARFWDNAERNVN